MSTTLEQRIANARAAMASLVTELPGEIRQIVLAAFDNGAIAATPKKQGVQLTERELSYLYQTALIDAAMRAGDIMSGVQLSVLSTRSFGDDFARELATIVEKLKEALPEGYCNCCQEVHEEGEHTKEE